MNQTKLELISEIRAGKALHYDIDNVELLNEVCHKAGSCYPRNYDSKYYIIGNWFWHETNSEPVESIPLSSFIYQRKMIDIEEVKEWCKKNLDETKNNVGESLISINDLLTFLNSHTNAK